MSDIRVRRRRREQTPRSPHGAQVPLMSAVAMDRYRPERHGDRPAGALLRGDVLWRTAPGAVSGARLVDDVHVQHVHLQLHGGLHRGLGTASRRVRRAERRVYSAGPPVRGGRSRRSDSGATWMGGSRGPGCGSTRRSASSGTRPAHPARHPGRTRGRGPREPPVLARSDRRQIGSAVTSTKRRTEPWSWPDSVDRSTLVRVRYRSGVVPWGGGLRDEPRPSLGAVIVRLDISVTGGACRDPLQLHRCELLTCTRRLAWALPERFRIPPRGSWEGCSGLAIAASMR